MQCYSVGCPGIISRLIPHSSTVFYEESTQPVRVMFHTRVLLLTVISITTSETSSCNGWPDGVINILCSPTYVIYTSIILYPGRRFPGVLSVHVSFTPSTHYHLNFVCPLLMYPPKAA